ncbi:hypothetical protein CLAFUW4_12901 [Fulvia fulva]|uniref:RING-type domain-containing protein n=1 Tax=Passalora fulva TaxID=5499 RepID=A0A9Q8PJ71_PASFU|nr:uncharacterized protein CLAFUR5_12767 [Fulvia fulva]KAK4611722.1 hypothetical protein CLAFUR4_12905 [Fulvia fulva]KAK4612723.1 hypothetical protein CLAFUR0_12911 [Fulvia fulva]UJO23374.1 hypothetical protein CLAFUR5_12767 [Fulvia fulva]WPV21465.1 hypothetical protein CLAFUW4_12901 [Fulvia fulva]WPV35784.1 hypothetical protein CLAFUW7_12908 [Fulvia fulva]
MTFPLSLSSGSVGSAILLGLFIYALTTGLDHVFEPSVATPLRWILFAAVLLEMLGDLILINAHVHLALGGWPTRRYGRLPSKDQIIGSLAPYLEAVAKDDICAFCRGPYEDPLELPCNHLYCKDCVKTLIEYGHNKCGLCYQEFYGPAGPVLSATARSKRTEAKSELLWDLMLWLMHAICLLLIVMYWTSIHAILDSKSWELVAAGHLTLAMLTTAYLIQVMLFAEILDCISNFREDWWREIHKCRRWRAWYWVLDCVAVVAVALVVAKLLWK